MILCKVNATLGRLCRRLRGNPSAISACCRIASLAADAEPCRPNLVPLCQRALRKAAFMQQKAMPLGTKSSSEGLRIASAGGREVAAIRHYLIC
jgi:hypothetical protein